MDESESSALPLGDTPIRDIKFSEKQKSHGVCFSVLVGVEGFEPSEWMSQSHLPYHLATPQYLVGIDGFEPSE